jgi:hypothetical protein
MRGNPVVRAARRWTFNLSGGAIAPTRGDNQIGDNLAQLQKLTDLAVSAKPVPFRSLDGRLYTAKVAPYVWTPKWNQNKTTLSMPLAVTLDQVEV